MMNTQLSLKGKTGVRLKPQPLHGALAQADDISFQCAFQATSAFLIWA